MANHTTGFVQVLGTRKAAGYRKLAEQMARDMKSPTAKDNPEIRTVLRRLRDNLGALADMIEPAADYANGFDPDLCEPAEDILDVL